MAPTKADEADDKAVVAVASHATAPDTSQLAKETLYVLFSVRCINAFACRTFFQPDEYYQALEPAWQMVFGPASGAWLTWEWTYGLRSSLHPAVFAIGYALVDNTIGNLYSVKSKWLVGVPRVMQVGFAALADWYTWRLSEKLYGKGSPTSWAAFAMTLLNPWHWYTATRTFSNCLEATLTIAALFYWPWELLGIQKSLGNSSVKAESAPLASTEQVKSLRLSLFLAALAVLLRPTNAVIWLAVGILMLTRVTLAGESPLTQWNLFVVVREAVMCGLAAVGLALLADRGYYGEWTFTAANLVHFNIAQDLATFYGQNDWHYYLSQGIPLTCTTFAPFVLAGLWKSTRAAQAVEGDVASLVPTRNALKALSFAALASIISLSLISHKEVRFITPLMPIFHVLAAPHILDFFTNVKVAAATAAASPPPRLQFRRTPLLALGVVINIIVAAYLSWFHAAGPNLVMTFLRNEFHVVHPGELAIDMNRRLPNTTSIAENTTTRQQQEEEVGGGRGGDELFALFLTPCHATPWRSHLVHPKLTARGLTCDPPVHTRPGSAERAAYQDETSRFFADPAAYLDAEVWPTTAMDSDSGSGSGSSIIPGRASPMARYIVAYDGLEDTLVEYFAARGGGSSKGGVKLQKVWSAWNGLFTDDERKAGNLNVWATGVYEEADKARMAAWDRQRQEARAERLREYEESKKQQRRQSEDVKQEL